MLRVDTLSSTTASCILFNRSSTVNTSGPTAACARHAVDTLRPCHPQSRCQWRWSDWRFGQTDIRPPTPKTGQGEVVRTSTKHVHLHRALHSPKAKTRKEAKKFRETAVKELPNHDWSDLTSMMDKTSHVQIAVWGRGTRSMRKLARVCRQARGNPRHRTPVKRCHNLHNLALWAASACRSWCCRTRSMTRHALFVLQE